VAHIPLSVCTIAHNEGVDLPDCLRSVSFADEIVVVDSHSSDRTREVAAAFRDGVAGVAVATVVACGTFLKYAKLWEKRNVEGCAPDRSP